MHPLFRRAMIKTEGGMLVKKVRFKDLSINTKFIVSLALLLLIPMILLFWFVNTRVNRELEAQSCQTVLETLKQAKTPLNTTVSDADYLSKEILANSTVQEYLRQCLCTPAEELFEYRYKVDLFLSQLLDSRPYILRAALFFNGELVTQSGAYLQTDTLPENIADLQLEKTVLYWTEAENNQAYLSRYERGYEITLLRAVNDIDNFGITLGTEKLTIREDYLCSLYSGVAAPQTQNMLLINDQGKVVSSIDKSLLDASTVKEDWYEMILGKSEGYFVTQDGRLISFCHLKNPGWYLVRIDSEVKMARSDSVVLICIALTLLFAVAFFTIQRKNIIAPIAELADEVRSFHDGNYTFTERRNAKDEIGELNRSCVEMGRYIQDLIERVYKSQLAEKETQLKNLQAQINPHFLYNTLESIRWMAIRNKQPDIAAQTEALARLFKHALNNGREMTTVREEISHVQDYMTIQTNRFGERIETLIQVEEEALDCVVLNLILQPLVENAYVHGLENKVGRGVVAVTVKRRINQLIYRVEDNGLGTDPEPVRRALAGKGEAGVALALTNIQNRLKYKYAVGYELIFDSVPGKGTTVTVTMPAQQETLL